MYWQHLKCKQITKQWRQLKALKARWQGTRTKHLTQQICVHGSAVVTTRLLWHAAAASGVYCDNFGAATTNHQDTLNALCQHLYVLHVWNSTRWGRNVTDKTTAVQTRNSSGDKIWSRTFFTTTSSTTFTQCTQKATEFCEKISPVRDWQSTPLEWLSNSRYLDLDLGSGHTAYRRASVIHLYLRTKCHSNRRNFFADGLTAGTLQVQGHMTKNRTNIKNQVGSNLGIVL